MFYKVGNKQGYLKLKKRVERGAKFLEGKWSDPKFQNEAKHYEAMAIGLLFWEIESGIFDDKFEKWKLERR